MSKYKSFFILPENTFKYLNIDGWNFDSKKGLSLELYSLIKEFFVGVEKESENDFILYVTDDMDYNFFIKNGEIYEAYIKVYNSKILEKLYMDLKYIKDLIGFEIFDPNEIFLKF